MSRVIFYRLKNREENSDLEKVIQIKKDEKGEGSGINLKPQGLIEKVKSEGEMRIKDFNERMKPAMEYVLDEGVSRKWSSVGDGQYWSTSGRDNDKNVVMVGSDKGSKRNVLFKFDLKDLSLDSYLVGIYEHKKDERRGILTLGLSTCEKPNQIQCQIQKREELSDKRITIVFENS